jgi:(hydroxyamino)benzene mutase
MDHQILKRRLLQLGILLFLFGLFTGFAIPAFTNPRMGLSSHLEGVMNGIFLIALGFIWPELRLSKAPSLTAFWLLVYGTYVNWLAVLLAGIFGTGALTPIAAAGHQGTPLQEAIVTVMLLSLSVAMIAGCIIVLWGLRGKIGDVKTEQVV